MDLEILDAQEEVRQIAFQGDCSFLHLVGYLDSIFVAYTKSDSRSCGGHREGIAWTQGKHRYIPPNKNISRRVLEVNSPRPNASRMVVKFLSDFDIFEPAILKCPMCRKYWQKVSSEAWCAKRDDLHSPTEPQLTNKLRSERARYRDEESIDQCHRCVYQSVYRDSLKPSQSTQYASLC